MEPAISRALFLCAWLDSMRDEIYRDNPPDDSKRIAADDSRVRCRMSWTLRSQFTIATLSGSQNEGPPALPEDRY
jgi:hypothetical protein